ncbi:MAG: alkaline phosphatase family protein, partial [Armatimonadetes bacterium]|nr:alkaline phosphatase family protein [Armatimonadota bacterium]
MAHPVSRKVLLVGIGGADWNLISPLLDAGELSFLRQMVEAGTMGDLATLSPALAEILWTSIATGKRAGKHGIHGFTEVDPETGKVRPVSSVSRRCKAVWNILQQNGLKVHVVNWFAGHPAEPLNGVAVSDFFPNVAGLEPEPWPLAEGSVHPAHRADYYAPMRVHPTEVRTDVGALFIRGLEKINQDKDPRPGLVAAELARAFTVQAVALDILEHEPWDFLAVHFRFMDILCHFFMPFHPPRMEHVPEELFEHYADTVNSAYRLLNLMLQKLVGIAGPEATVLVISDHGFHHGDLRPGADGRPEMWHREQGVLLACGPGIRRDELIHGAGVLDIAPTLLGLFGLPVGKDMDGRVLTALFKEEPEVKYLPSWEDVDGEAGMHPPGTRLPEADARVLLDQFIALGYIQPLDPDAEKAAEQTRLQNLFNLARDYLDCAAWEKALPLLEELHDAQFAMPESSLQLAFCQWRLGLTGEAERTAGDVLRLVKEGPLLSLLLGHLALERADAEQAVAHYRKAAELVKDARGLYLSIGSAWLRVKRLDEAEAAFRKVLEAEPKNALALQGLAHTHLLAERWQQAADAALDAVAVQHALPTAHAILAQALERLGRYPDAQRAWQTSLVYDPDQAHIHKALADLYEYHLKDLRPALPHRLRAEQLRRAQEDETGRRARLRR